MDMVASREGGRGSRPPWKVTSDYRSRYWYGPPREANGTIWSNCFSGEALTALCEIRWRLEYVSRTPWRNILDPRIAYILYITDLQQSNWYSVIIRRTQHPNTHAFADFVINALIVVCWLIDNVSFFYYKVLAMPVTLPWKGRAMSLDFLWLITQAYENGTTNFLVESLWLEQTNKPHRYQNTAGFLIGGILEHVV